MKLSLDKMTLKFFLCVEKNCFAMLHQKCVVFKLIKNEEIEKAKNVFGYLFWKDAELKRFDFGCHDVKYGVDFKFCEFISNNLTQQTTNFNISTFELVQQFSHVQWWPQCRNAWTLSFSKHSMFLIENFFISLFLFQYSDTSSTSLSPKSPSSLSTVY